jgi:hypothetical protein
MSFSGHHALNASDQVQKKLQETMADEEQLNDAMAGMDMRDTVKDAEMMAME